MWVLGNKTALCKISKCSEWLNHSSSSNNTFDGTTPGKTATHSLRYLFFSEDQSGKKMKVSKILVCLRDFCFGQKKKQPNFLKKCLFYYILLNPCPLYCGTIIHGLNHREKGSGVVGRESTVYVFALEGAQLFINIQDCKTERSLSGQTYSEQKVELPIKPALVSTNRE